MRDSSSPPARPELDGVIRILLADGLFLPTSLLTVAFLFFTRLLSQLEADIICLQMGRMRKVLKQNFSQESR